jgi:hypothetical protein
MRVKDLTPGHLSFCALRVVSPSGKRFRLPTCKGTEKKRVCNVKRGTGAMLLGV